MYEIAVGPVKQRLEKELPFERWERAKRRNGFAEKRKLGSWKRHGRRKMRFYKKVLGELVGWIKNQFCFVSKKGGGNNVENKEI